MSSKELQPLAAHILGGFSIRVSEFYPAGSDRLPLPPIPYPLYLTPYTLLLPSSYPNPLYLLPAQRQGQQKASHHGHGPGDGTIEPDSEVVAARR